MKNFLKHSYLFFLLFLALFLFGCATTAKLNYSYKSVVQCVDRMYPKQERNNNSKRTGRQRHVQRPVKRAVYMMYQPHIVRKKEIENNKVYYFNLYQTRGKILYITDLFVASKGKDLTRVKIKSYIPGGCILLNSRDKKMELKRLHEIKRHLKSKDYKY